MKKVRLIPIGILTADDEEPNCGRCNHMFASQEYCDECGNNFWCHYERTDYIKKEVDE